MNAKILITAAAREAARKAAVDGGASAAAIQRAVDCTRLGKVGVSGLTVSIKPATAAYGSTITVKVAAMYQPITTFVGAISGGPIRLESEIVTRSEKVR